MTAICDFCQKEIKIVFTDGDIIMCKECYKQRAEYETY